MQSNYSELNKPKSGDKIVVIRNNIWTDKDSISCIGRTGVVIDEEYKPNNRLYTEVEITTEYTTRLLHYSELYKLY